MDNRPIGIFDSGIGGLSVLHQALKSLPNENYLYFADVDNVPYGLKTNKQIKEYVNSAAQFMINKNVKAIVIACNTATSVDIEELRQKYTIPIIGIEPAVKPAINLNKDKRILLIATPVTVREEKLKKLLEKIDKEKKVDLIALPGLVKYAEKEEFVSKELEDYLNKEFIGLDLNNYSELVLGCTHFNYFKDTFRKIFPNEINILDGNKGIVNRLKSILKENDLLGNEEKRNIEYYFSGRLVQDEKYIEKIKRLNKRLDEMLTK